MTFVKTTQTPAIARNKKRLRFRFFTSIRLRLRKNLESCRSRIRIRGHLWLLLQFRHVIPSRARVLMCVCVTSQGRDCSQTLGVMEIALRSAKHVMRNYLQQVDQASVSSAVSHFLNCFLGSCPSPVPALPEEELIRWVRNVVCRRCWGVRCTKWGNLTFKGMGGAICKWALKSDNYFFSLTSCLHSEFKLIFLRGGTLLWHSDFQRSRMIFSCEVSSGRQSSINPR